MKKELSAIAAGMILAGCGGSSGGGSDNSPETPQRTVTADMKFSSRCDVEEPADGIRFITHRADGSILSEVNTGADGKLSIPWNNDSAHLTMSYKDDQGETEVYTRLNLSAGDLGVQKIYLSNLNSQCECKTLSFDVSDIEAQFYDSDLYIGNNQYKPGYTTEICKSGGSFPLISFTVIPRSGDAPRANTFNYNQYPEQPTVIELDSSMFFADISRSEQLEVNYISSSFDVRKYTFSETPYGRMSWINWENEPYIFPNLFEHNFVTGNLFEYVDTNENGDIYYASQRRKRVNSTAETIDINIPENKEEMLLKTAELLLSLTENSATAFDFTNIGEGRNIVTFELSQSSVASWRIQAPLTGVLPDFDLPNDIQNELQKIERPDFTVQVYGYHSGLSADDFRDKVAEINRQNLEIRSSFFDNYEVDSILIRAN